MPSIFSRVTRHSPAPAVKHEPSMSMAQAKAVLAKTRFNLESSLNVLSAVGSNIETMQRDALSFRNSRVKAYDMLNRVVMAKRGKPSSGLNLESFGITDFVSNAVKTNLESAEEFQAEVKQQVIESVSVDSVIPAAKDVLANALQALDKLATQTDADLVALRDGNADCCVNGAEGARVEAHLTAEGVAPESDCGKRLVESLTAAKEQGYKLEFDIDSEATSVVIASKEDISSDIARFPLEFYLLVRKALPEDQNVPEDKLVEAILAKHYTLNQLVDAAMNTYANHSYAGVNSINSKDFTPSASVMRMVVKSYSSNPYRPLIELGNTLQDKVVDDLSVVKKVLASADCDESTKMAASVYAGFICLLLNVIK